MAKISGILKDGAGQIINDCTIELYAKKTTNNVLTQTQAFTVANDGRYSINAQPCEYDVSLIINGFPKKRLGAIAVYSDSVDGSLNDYLINPPENDLTPEFLKQVFDARSEAKNSAIASSQSATNSENSATAAKTSEINAQSSADTAKENATTANNFATAASKSSETANDAASEANTAATNAKVSADNASKSETAASKHAKKALDSAEVAKTSETNAQSSASEAKASADTAKQWASTVEHSNFVKKTGADSQSIDGELIVGTLSANEKINASEILENGNRVYSPSNQPTADIIGALPVVKIADNEISTYSVDDNVDFKKIPTVGGKSVITDLTDVDNRIELINTELSNASNQIKDLNDRIYVVESYCDGYSWYRVYSDGFIVQSSTALIGIPNANVVCGTLINLLKPMRTLHYGVSIDKLYSGAWGMNAFSSSELYQSSFWLAAYSTIACDGWIRWTVQGY